MGGGLNGQVVSIKKAADRRWQRCRENIDEKREKYRARMDPCGISRLSRKERLFFDKPRKRAYQKGKIESNEQSKEKNQPK